MSLVAIPEAGLVVVILVIAVVGIKAQSGDFGSRPCSRVVLAVCGENVLPPPSFHSKQLQISERR